MLKSDQYYVGIPWKDGGRNIAGCDCVGLVCLFLSREFGFEAAVPGSDSPGVAEDVLRGKVFDEAKLQRGDVVFFRDLKGRLRHVAVWLGGGKLLHVAKGCDSRIENGLTLARRVGLKPGGALSPTEVETLARALADDNLGEPATIIAVIGLVLAIALSIAAQLLMPKLARLGNKYGRYGFDALVTQNSPEIPLPDLLGEVVVAGNSPYTQLSDKNLTSNPTLQRANKVVILCSGPCEEIGAADLGVTVNGLSFNDKFFHDDTIEGIFLDPAQTKAEAVEGTILADTLVPSVSLYDGSHGIMVPVDVRAEYDRTFPVYGFAGCSYLVFRLIDSTKFNQFNLTARVKGRRCRTFGSSGFITANNNQNWTGDSVTTRFKLGTDDIAVMNSLDVDGSPFDEISASAQTGDVYQLNRTKGYIEFITAPGVGEDIYADFDAYVRDWSQNPALQLVYLLTEVQRGKGFAESKINWPAAVAFRDYCDAEVTWMNSNGVTTGVRYTSNYAVDFRKPVQEHLQAVLDSSNAMLFLSGGKFVMKARAAAASVFSFDETNILKESFTAELVDRVDRPNRLKLFFHSKTAYNAETEVVREDAVDQRARSPRAGNEGIVEENLKFLAVDNQEQAERLGESVLRESVNQRWVCVFRTTLLGLALEPGDVVDVTHSSQPAWAAKLFRVEAITHGSDDRMELHVSEYFAGAFL